MSKKTKHDKKVSEKKPVSDGISLFSRNNLFAVLIITIVTFIAYRGALQNDFVNLDDDRYVTENPKLFLQPAGDMFKIPEGYHMGNYHPLTMLGYKMIYTKVKLDPYVYHLVNVVLHILNSLLVFYFIFLLTSVFEIAFASALLFGVHTMHVESVAWVSELKDLLYAFFFFAALIVYVRYAKDRSRKGLYAIALVLFLLSLLSKAMAASLSVVLIAIDYYIENKLTKSVLLEKIPFFILSLIFGIIAVKAQQSMDAVGDLTIFKPYERVALASYGFITYLWKLILPMNLSAYYAYPLKQNGALPPAYYLYVLLALSVVTAAIYSLRNNKFVFFGIAFFSITVFLVLQLLPVGGAVMADRYSYIPSLGIFFILAHLLYALYRKSGMQYVATVLLLMATIGYSYATVQRCKIWKDGMTMWTDVIEKSQTIALAYNNRGVLFNTEGKQLLEEAKSNAAKKQEAINAFNRAISDFNNALRLNSKDTQAWSNKGLAYWRMGINDSAIIHLNNAVTIDPKYAIGWSNLGSVYFSINRIDEAIDAYEKAVTYNPSFSDGWYNIGILNYNLGRKDKACESLNKAASLGMEHAANAYRDLCK
jgi:tetratricopeptide (TPR) repeat protein